MTDAMRLPKGTSWTVLARLPDWTNGEGRPVSGHWRAISQGENEGDALAIYKAAELTGRYVEGGLRLLDPKGVCIRFHGLHGRETT